MKNKPHHLFKILFITIALPGCGNSSLMYSGPGTETDLMRARYSCLQSSKVTIEKPVMSFNSTLAAALLEESGPKRIPTDSGTRILTALTKSREAQAKAPKEKIKTCSRSAFETCLGAMGYFKNKEGNLSIPYSSKIHCEAS